MRSKYEERFLRIFGRRIANCRKRTGITQVEFANKVGISPSSIVSIETGRRWPHLSIIHRIADALDMTAAELVSNVEKEILAEFDAMHKK